MRLIDEILSKENIDSAIKRVKTNKGCAGIDKMKVDKLEDHFKINGKTIINSILEGTYKPQLVKRVYIPKPNGKQRPLGIPTATDRVITINCTKTKRNLWTIFQWINLIEIIPNFTQGSQRRNIIKYIGPQKEKNKKELTLELLYDLDNPYGFRDFDWEEFKINHSLDKRTLKKKRV